MKQFKHFKGVFEDKDRIYTKSFDKGYSVYGERTKGEYREWNPHKSKLCAGLKKNISQIGIKPGSRVLYLGSSSGTTVSHVSDIVGEEGYVFALDFSPRMVRDLLKIAERRKNIAPLLENAFKPEDYTDKLASVDVIFQDIAQRNQVEIFKKNIEYFLPKGGFGIIAVKARSINVSEKPGIVFNMVEKELSDLTIVDKKNLAPFEKDHMIFVIKA